MNFYNCTFNGNVHISISYGSSGRFTGVPLAAATPTEATPAATAPAAAPVPAAATAPAAPSPVARYLQTPRNPATPQNPPTSMPLWLPFAPGNRYVYLLDCDVHGETVRRVLDHFVEIRAIERDGSDWKITVLNSETKRMLLRIGSVILDQFEYFFDDGSEPQVVPNLTGTWILSVSGIPRFCDARMLKEHLLNFAEVDEVRLPYDRPRAVVECVCTAETEILRNAKVYFRRHPLTFSYMPPRFQLVDFDHESPY